MDNETNQGFSSSWNSASAIMFEIAKLRAKANTFYTSGALRQAINNLIAISQTVVSILSDTEVEALDVLESQFYDVIVILDSGEETFDGKDLEWIEAKKKLLKIYSNYNRTIMRALQAHDLLLSEKTDTTKMQA